MIVKELGSKNKKFLPPEKMEELVKKMRKEGDVLIKGMFEFTDAQGGWFDFSYRFFKEPIKTFRLIHGEICELPAYIVKHLNNTYKKIRVIGEDIKETNSSLAGRKLPDRGLSSTIVQKISRVRFIPMDAM